VHQIGYSPHMRIIPRVLDSTYGRAAVGVSAILARADGADWEPLAKAESGRFGCFEEWLRLNLARGFYRISFDCGSYFSSLGELGAYPEVGISFRLREEFETLSIRLDLSPYSYTVHFATDLSGRHSRPVTGCGDAGIVEERRCGLGFAAALVASSAPCSTPNSTTGCSARSRPPPAAGIRHALESRVKTWHKCPSGWAC